MNLINERTQVRTVAARWRAQYSAIDTRFPGIYERLAALDVETATAKDVAKIIGNKSWVPLRYSCDDCGAEVAEVVQVGQEPDYDSSTAYLCRDCLMAALRLCAEAP